MRKSIILLVAFLLPLSALEMSADEKGTIRPIPLIKVEKKDLSRSVVQESIMTVYYGPFSSVQTTVTEDLGTVEVTVVNATTGEMWYDSFDSAAEQQTLLPISGTPGYYEIEYVTESGDVYAGEFLIE